MSVLDRLPAKQSKAKQSKAKQSKAKLIEKYGDVVCALSKYYSDCDDSKRFVEEGYLGEYDSELDFATQLFDDCYDIPEHLKGYVDYEQFRYDIFIGDYFSVYLNGVTHVFLAL